MRNLVVPVQLRCRPLIAGALLSAAVVIASSGVHAGETIDETISVLGNRRIDAETVRSYFHPAPDGHYDAAALDDALKALIATNLFDNVTIDHPGGRLVVHLTEAKMIDRLAFEGNKKIKDDALKAVVESKPRGPLQRALVQADAGRIAEAYRHAARNDVSVAPQIIDRGNDRVDLVFDVKEGEKTTVRKINFIGNQAFSSRQLGAIIKTSATTMLSFLTGGNVYDPDQIAADREQIRLYYRSKGFADAAVTKASAEYDPAQKGFVVTFAIDEGPLYRYGDITLACDVPDVDPEKLRRLLLIKTGALFDGNTLDKSTEIVGTELGKLGFPFAQATARATNVADVHRVDIAFAIDQGPRRYVERIEIHGNTITRGYVIRREFDIAEGDAYNKSLIDRAERRLKNLNYFKTVKISTKPGSASDRVVLDVELAEQSTGEFNISGGYSTTDGLLAEVKVGENNFLGTGDVLKASVSWGQYAQGVDLSASEPYFLGTKVAAGVELFYKITDSSPYQSYGSDSYGATMSLGTPINEQMGVQWRYSISRQDVTLDPAQLAGTPSLPIQLAALAGPQWVSAVGDTVKYNTLDNNKLPTSGISSQLSQDLAGLGGDVNFLRTTEDVRYYHRINDDLVGMVRAQGGYIAPLGRPAGAADRQLFRRPVDGSRICTRTDLGRAISRPAPPWIMSAAVCTGRRPRSCRARSPACRRNMACGPRPLSMPAACFIMAAPPPFRARASRCNSPTPISCARRSASA